ncbi:MAG: hypothetical protein Q8R05_00480 [Candidatus Omnitrophota bacterium]|nr:hypothetical protein [Candidatus Omnitrophota bacterium]
MKKFFLTIITAFFIIFYSNAANPQEGGEAPVSPLSEQAATATEAPVAETTSQTPALEAAPEVPAEGEEIILIDDTLPEGSTTEGTWEWDTSLKYSGEKSHTESAAKSATEHSYRTKPVIIPKNSVIEQYIYLDPNDMPKGIMLKFRFENDGKEDEIGIYREGEEEVFMFNNDEPMLYDGTLPNAGKWEKLQIYCDDLGLVGAKLTGISFVTYGGRAYWDLTRIRAVKEGEQYPPEE